MLSSTTLLLSILPILVSATPISKRAGGPAIVPIPSDCPIDNPLPGTSGYEVSDSFSSSNSLYSFYITSTLSPSDQAQQCFEQCYGYGNPGQCKSALLAYNVPTPPGYYGTAGGVLETACFMYSEFLTSGDFVAAPEGQYTDESAENIRCVRDS